MTLNIAFGKNYFNHISCSDMIYVVEVPVPTNSQNSVNYKYGRNITSVKNYCYFKYDYCNTIISGKFYFASMTFNWVIKCTQS